MINSVPKVVLMELFDRYYWLMADSKLPMPNYPQCTKEHLMNLCREAKIGLELENMAYGKICRWLGFIQGVLCSSGITTVEFERDFTRPIFKGKE